MGKRGEHTGPIYWPSPSVPSTVQKHWKTSASAVEIGGSKQLRTGRQAAVKPQSGEAAFPFQSLPSWKATGTRETIRTVIYQHFLEEILQYLGNVKLWLPFSKPIQGPGFPKPLAGCWRVTWILLPKVTSSLITTHQKHTGNLLQRKQISRDKENHFPDQAIKSCSCKLIAGSQSFEVPLHFAF